MNIMNSTTYMWQAEIPGCYQIESDSLVSVDVLGGVDPGAGPVVELLGYSFTHDLARKLRDAIDQAISSSTPCTDSRCLGYCAPLGAAGTLEATE